jgi:hypothetical protein
VRTRVTHHSTRDTQLVKRISSFDDAQDGEPVEPYLAKQMIRDFFQSCASRFTRYASRKTLGRIRVSPCDRRTALSRVEGNDRLH